MSGSDCGADFGNEKCSSAGSVRGCKGCSSSARENAIRIPRTCWISTRCFSRYSGRGGVSPQCLRTRESLPFARSAMTDSALMPMTIFAMFWFRRRPGCPLYFYLNEVAHLICDRAFKDTDRQKAIPTAAPNPCPQAPSF